MSENEPDEKEVKIKFNFAESGKIVFDKAVDILTTNRDMTIIRPELFLPGIALDEKALLALQFQGITGKMLKVAVYNLIRPAPKPPEEQKTIAAPLTRLSFTAINSLKFAEEWAALEGRGIEALDILGGICYECHNDGAKILEGLGFNWNAYEAQQSSIDVFVEESKQLQV